MTSGQPVSDKERFPCAGNAEWQYARPVTYFYEELGGALVAEGMQGFRRHVVRFIQSKRTDAGVYLEYVNAVTHIMLEVGDWAGKAGVREEALKTCVEGMFKELHWFYRNYADRRGWHIRLSKFEKKYL